MVRDNGTVEIWGVGDIHVKITEHSLKFGIKGRFGLSGVRDTTCPLYRGFAWRPCCMPGTIKMFCIRMNILSHRNNIVMFLACNMAAMQNLYTCAKLYCKMTMTSPKVALSNITYLPLPGSLQMDLFPPP